MEKHKWRVYGRRALKVMLGPERERERERDVKVTGTLRKLFNYECNHPCR